MSIAEVLTVLLVGAVLGWLLGVRFSRLSEATGVRVATEEARTAIARAVTAEGAAKTTEAELTRLREQVISYEVENARLQVQEIGRAHV
jgi:hypothetical protein